MSGDVRFAPDSVAFGVASGLGGAFVWSAAEITERKAKKSTSAKRSAPARRAAEVLLNRRIVDATLDLAEEVGWEGLRLRRVAERLGVPLAEALDQYRDLDAVADAWFRRAWAAMLEPPPEDFATRPACERLHLMMMRWFAGLMLDSLPIALEPCVPPANARPSAYRSAGACLVRPAPTPHQEAGHEHKGRRQGQPGAAAGWTMATTLRLH